MKKVFKFCLIATLSIITGSDLFGDDLEDIVYETVAYDGWPIFMFYRVTGPEGDASQPYKFRATNGGWTDKSGSAPIYYSGYRGDQIDDLVFEFIWLEPETQEAYQARIEVTLDDLKEDPIRTDHGLLIFRFARGGDLQAVTYDPDEYPENSTPIEIAHVCGSPTDITDPAKLQEIKRLWDHWNRDGAIFSIPPEDVPSRCE